MARVHEAVVRTRLSLPALLIVAGCVSAPPPPPPPARSVTPPRTAAPPPPAPLASDWRDWPQTPGDWRYVADPYGSIAEFGHSGARVFNLGCDRSVRRVTLTIEQPSDASVITVRTSTVTRAVPVTVVGHPPVGGSVQLPATDPLLDAIGFSRGRFVVEQPGRAPLVLPAWPEVERVVEDCRA